MLDAQPDDATDLTIVEMSVLLWLQAIIFVVIERVGPIVLPSHASLDIGQRMAESAERVTDAAGPGCKEVWTAVQFALTTKPKAARQVFVPSETARLASSSTPNTQPFFCQL
ncbi:hypothetical protein [Bradyrhizobium sp. 159]|uniref:hypothetical protein n=1 Tax=Bradyrhizobium sp. 159 TaxID=2782632 RepID=UPI0031FE77B3